ncbi:MAG: DUF1697 domain-containing protein [Gaiellaceae bacterium]
MPARRQTYVALLRGINLGSRNRIAMADLRALVAALGHEDVTTYLQSGNVVFRSSGRAADLRRGLEARIARDHGLAVTVLLRTRAELARLVTGNPFAERGGERTLHVTFLADKPEPVRARDLDAAHGEPDEFRLAGRDVYLYCPNGYGKSKLANAFFEQRLGVAATTRNWRTVTSLAELTGA